MHRVGTAALIPGSYFFNHYGYLVIHSFILQTPFCLPSARHGVGDSSEKCLTSWGFILVERPTPSQVRK